MTGKSSRTTIYSRQDLAELVAKHDREHPDHGNDCACHNGLIATLRMRFASAVPTPGVATSAAQAAETHESGARKPWLNRRAGETQAQHDHRISHSCYNCGAFIVDMEALNRHEDECSAQGRRKTPPEV